MKVVSNFWHNALMITPIGENIQKRLDALNDARSGEVKKPYTWYWLAGQMGIKNSQLSNFRYNKTAGISWPMLNKLCRALGCQPGDLLQYAEEPHQSNGGYTALVPRK